ncbi:MAG: FAD-binding protein, partial [Lentisphaeria bacterium]|nr:FAD-binding protein [Lentisphaeria bacterium]
MKRLHTLIIGSGAAGLAATLRLNARGIRDLAIYTEGLQMGTSINTGSDKQTYYKLGMYGAEPDAPVLMAQDLAAGGGMHGDIALAEAALSPLGFSQLVMLGVAFPHDCWGQYIGYKTDHDPRRRATSTGPYTSRDMCRAMIAEVGRRGIPVNEDQVAVKLLTDDEKTRVIGAVFCHTGTGEWEAVQAENVIFAVGGPGGLYEASVYPKVHTGAIGLALEAGAAAYNLAESQFGLASVKFRWNVSGSFMQVLPRFISTDADGGDEREFLREYFDTPAAMYDAIFLKGYQWPFAAAHVPGSSWIDIFTYIECVERKRRVWLDFRCDPADLEMAALGGETREYLAAAGAWGDSPLERLQKLNAPAIELYRKQGILLDREPLEIAVCAQHNNGGLAGDIWWESVNLRHLFPVGEVNGSHGVTRPGGSALNAGQVGAIRAAERVARCPDDDRFDPAEFDRIAGMAVAELTRQQAIPANCDWR